MIHIIASFAIPAENQAAFVKLAKELVAETLKEAGNISYEFVQGADDPTRSRRKPAMGKSATSSREEASRTLTPPS